MVKVEEKSLQVHVSKFDSTGEESISVEDWRDASSRYVTFHTITCGWRPESSGLGNVILMKSTVGSGLPWTSQYFGNMTFIYAASGSSAKWNSVPTCGMENSMTKCSVTTSYRFPDNEISPFVSYTWTKEQRPIEFLVARRKTVGIG